MEISIIKIRRSRESFMFTMGIHILIRLHLVPTSLHLMPESYLLVRTSAEHLFASGRVIGCKMFCALQWARWRLKSGAVQRKYQSSVSLASVREIHRWPVNSPHKGPVTRKIFPFYDVIRGLIHRNPVYDSSCTQRSPQKTLIWRMAHSLGWRQYRWLSARLQQLQCVSNGVTAVLH